MKKILLTFALLCSLSVFAQWEPVALPTTENLIAISFKDNMTGFCIAENGVILKTTDGGITWVTIHNNSNHNYKHLACVDDKVVVFGTESIPYSRRVFTSLDEGVTWTNAVNTVYPYVENEAVQVLNNEIYYKGLEASTINLYKFNNNNPIAIANHVFLFGVTDSTDEIIYLGQPVTVAVILKSTDIGATWQPLAGHPQWFFFNQTFLAKMKSFNDIILIHYTYANAVTYSLDNGATWTTTMDGIIQTEIVNSTTIYGLSSNTIYINTNYVDWVEQTAFNGVTLNNIYFKSAALGFVFGQNGAMYRTVNGGLSVTDYELLEKSIKVYPVPAKDVVQIELPLGLKVTALNLYDTNGRLVQRLKNSDSTLQINNLSSGIYLLEVSTDKGVVRKKIIVE